MRPRRKHLKSALPPREVAICQRLAEARRLLELDQAGAARKVGIPKSTLASYELAIAPLKADLALRICRRLILNEEWLATGRFVMAERAGKQQDVSMSQPLVRIHSRQCMDLLSSLEASRLPPGILFSEAFDTVLAAVYEKRIRANYLSPGIAAAAWSDNNIELGYDINQVLVERFVSMIQNEAIRRNCSPHHAGAVYLGFLMRMATFGFKKCMSLPVTAEQVGIPENLLLDPQTMIPAFIADDASHSGQFATMATVAATKRKIGTAPPGAGGAGSGGHDPVRLAVNTARAIGAA